jgi:hypothetical protein
MCNLLLREFRRQGLVTGPVLPFADLGIAADLARRIDREAILMASVNGGNASVVSRLDAARLVALGYQSYSPPVEV